MSKSKELKSRLIYMAVPGLAVGVFLVGLAPFASGIKQAAYDLYKHAVFIHSFLLALAAFVVSSSLVVQGADIAERLETYFFVPLLEVMAHLFAVGAADKVTWHTLYLWALVAYPVRWAPHHQELIDKWRKRVWSDLKQCAREGRTSAHLRNRKFDPLLGRLFPELRQHLEVLLPGERGTPAVAQAKPPERGPSRLEDQLPLPRTSRGWWLTGEDLENWKRQNPEAAQAWEGFTLR